MRSGTYVKVLNGRYKGMVGIYKMSSSLFHHIYVSCIEKTFENNESVIKKRIAVPKQDMRYPHTGRVKIIRVSKKRHDEYLAEIMAKVL